MVGRRFLRLVSVLGVANETVAVRGRNPKVGASSIINDSETLFGGSDAHWSIVLGILVVSDGDLVGGSITVFGYVYFVAVVP